VSGTFFFLSLFRLAFVRSFFQSLFLDCSFVSLLCERAFRLIDLLARGIINAKLPLDTEYNRATMDDGHAMLMESPFVISHEDVKAMEASQAFAVLRNYLARDAEYVLSSPLALSHSPGCVAYRASYRNRGTS
jgi:hypothetical protein